MASSLESDDNVVIAANTDADGRGGDIILWTGGLERARLRSDGTGTGVFGNALTVLNVKTQYGAVGDGVTNDTAAIQAALAAVPAAGAIVYFPPGIYSVPNGGLTCANPVAIMGAGAGAGSLTTPFWVDGISQINVSAGNVVALSLGAHRSRVNNISIRCTGVPAAGGAGIQTVSGGGNHNRYRDISVRGFYINLDHQYGTEWSADGNFFYDHGIYGLKIQNLDNLDGGDMSVANNLIYGGPTNVGVAGSAGIRYESGGGLRVIGNKFNWRGSSANYHDHCIDLAIADGANTGELYLVGNGFSCAKVAAIRLRQGGTTGIFSRIVITGNDISPFNTAGRSVQVDPGVAGKIQNVTITGNTMKNENAAVYAISLANVDKVSVASNTYTGPGSSNARLICGAGVTGLQVAPGDNAGVGPTADQPTTTQSAPGNSFFDLTLGKWQYAEPNTVGTWVLPRGSRVASLAYSASITPVAPTGDIRKITVTDGVAFTINAPTSPPGANNTQQLLIEVTNSSGGAMGVITWNAIFNFAGLVWTNPANTKKRWARFEWFGTQWVCTGVAGGDY